MTDYELLRNEAGRIRVERDFIELSGKDHVRWLQGMITQEITTLTVGGGAMAAACNRQGKMVSTMVLRIRDGSILLEIPTGRGDTLAEHFDKLIIMDDVKMDRPKYDVFEVHGPGSTKIVDLTRVPWFHFLPFGNGFASRNRRLGVEGLTLINAESDVPDVSAESVETMRIENGWPEWGIDMGPDELPMEANLDPIAITYNKGCYLGQEVLLRVKTYSEPPQKLVWLSIDSETAPEPGAKFADNAGRITSSVVSPRSGHAVAIAFVRKEHNAVGTRLEVDGKPAAVNDPPWHKSAEKPPEAKRDPGLGII